MVSVYGNDEVGMFIG